MVRQQNLLVIFALLWLTVIILAIKLQKHELNSHRHGRFTVTPIGTCITIVYGPCLKNSANLLDLCLPSPNTAKSSPYPLVVYIHGGAWQAGSKANLEYRQELNRHGYAAASLNYRLTGDAPHPAQIKDCKEAISWLREHARLFQIDPDRIGVWGQSAGGHLAALIGTTGDAKEPIWASSSSGISNKVQAVCDWCGPSDLTTMEQQAGSTYVLAQPVTKFLGGTPEEKKELAKEASPVTYAHKGCPPFLIMHGDQDTTVPVAQSIELAKSLKAAGVNCTLDIIPGANHLLDSPAAVKKVIQFFDLVLKKQSMK